MLSTCFSEMSLDGDCLIVQSLSPVRHFETPWTAARQASLLCYFPEFAQIHVELMTPSKHLILSPPSPALSLSRHQGLFQ